MFFQCQWITISVRKHAHIATHTAIMISHPFPKRKSAVALYCPPSKVERRERTQSDCGKKSDKSHRNKRNLSFSTLALSPLSAVYTEQTPVAGQETTAHTNKNCKPTLTHTGDRVAFPCPLRVWVGRSSGWSAAVSSVSGLILSGKQCNSCTIPLSSPLTHSPSFSLFPLILCYALSRLDLLHLRSPWVGQWHLRRFIKSASNITNKGKVEPWTQRGGIISHASSERHTRPPNKTNLIAKIFSWNTINGFRFSK